MRISDWSSDVCSSDLPYRAAGKRRTGTVTRALDIGAIRAQVRALDYVRGTPAEVAMWREGDAEARANLAIEGMDLDADEHALRSDERRVGKEGVSTCRSRWSPDPSNKKLTTRHK